MNWLTLITINIRRTLVALALMGTVVALLTLAVWAIFEVIP